MPTFDRKAALEAGWSEQEIDNFLSQQSTPSPPIGAAGSRAAPPPDEPGLQDTSFEVLPFLMGPLAGVARAGAGMVGSAASRIAANAGSGLVRGVARTANAPILKRLPGTAMLRGMSKDAAGMLERKAVPAAAPKPKLVAKAEAKAPQRKPSRPKRAKKPEPKLGSAESRIKAVKPAAKPEPRAVATRIRDTAPRARAQGPRPKEYALTQPHSLEDILKLSVGLEDEMTRRGLNEAQKALLRQEARRLVSGLP